MAYRCLTDWGLPSLRRAVTDQWVTVIPTHRRRQPVAPVSYANLITRNCCLPCCAVADWIATLEYPLQGERAASHAWARIKEILGCQIARIPLSASLMRSKGMQAIHLALALLQELLIICQRWHKTTFRSSIPVLLLGVAPFFHLPVKAITRDLPFWHWESSVYNTTILSSAGSCAVLLQFKGKPRRHINHKHSSTCLYT